MSQQPSASRPADPAGPTPDSGAKSPHHPVTVARVAALTGTPAQEDAPVVHLTEADTPLAIWVLPGRLIVRSDALLTRWPLWELAANQANVVDFGARLSVLRPPEGAEPVVRAEVEIPTAAGLSDRQLADAVQHALARVPAALDGLRVIAAELQAAGRG